ADLLIVSPGVSLDHWLVRKAQSKGIKVIGELETASYFFSGKIIAVTGTNGKSTTTALTGHILKTAGVACSAAGNIGLPFSEVADERFEAAVIEVSSYQLETIDTFHPHVAVWLNLTPDHLGRHGSMTNYASMKARIFSNQNAQDWLVYNASDKITAEYCSRAVSRLLPFDISGASGAVLRDKIITIMSGSGESEEILPADEMLIKGRHNIENALAASAAGWAYGISAKSIAEGLKTFKGLEHRQEFVREYHGVRFCNDSKATNVASGITALQSIDAPIILIAGGRGKGDSFADASDLISKKVRLIIAIGETAEQIENELSSITIVKRASDMKEAVNTALANAVSGDNVLLSPMCASFDMYDDFEHRGRVFKELVNDL
ncbi:MAG: UDP-N-acetylmuramoyl-L-alanine--D-glutamate ligase, partial [FCB group bacterium]|nr:UDP-N-acetylmuramoyl-L-alanine--D-glutamate ligase [FCB group bacterium]